MGSRPAPRVRPAGWWYIVPAALAVLACVLGVAAIVRGFEDAEQTALDASTAAPGVEQTITIREPAGYTVAYFGPVIVRSTGEREQLIEDLAIRIVPADGGGALPLRPYDGLNDLTAEGQQYVPLLTVRFEEPGDYVLHTSPSSGIDPERAGVAVSESPYRRLRSGAERAVALVVVGLGLAVLVTVILARVRGRSKAALRALLPPPAPWPSPVPHGAPPPGGWRSPQPGWPGPPPAGWSAPPAAGIGPPPGSGWNGPPSGPGWSSPPSGPGWGIPPAEGGSVPPPGPGWGIPPAEGGSVPPPGPGWSSPPASPIGPPPGPGWGIPPSEGGDGPPPGPDGGGPQPPAGGWGPPGWPPR